MSDDIINYLYKAIRKEPEYKSVVKTLERRFLSAVYLNMFSEESDTQQFSKQLAFAGGQKDLSRLWTVIRGVIGLHVDLQGNPSHG